MIWISVEDRLPQDDTICMVTNSLGWMHCEKAVYQKSAKVFVLVDMDIRKTLTLHVTHWFEIPPCPKDF